MAEEVEIWTIFWNCRVLNMKFILRFFLGRKAKRIDRKGVWSVRIEYFLKCSYLRWYFVRSRFFLKVLFYSVTFFFKHKGLKVSKSPEVHKAWAEYLNIFWNTEKQRRNFMQSTIFLKGLSLFFSFAFSNVKVLRRFQSNLF